MSDNEKHFGFTGGSGTDKDIAKIGSEAARARFSPEFFNRIRTIAAFNPLSLNAMRAIVLLELRLLQEMLDLRGANSFKLRLTESAREFIVKEGFDKRYGARHLNRALERLIVKPLARLIASGQVKALSTVVAHINEHGNGLVFRMTV
jgi:ATP-dependent Clp protease ATP-binding subunit ClpB